MYCFVQCCTISLAASHVNIYLVLIQLSSISSLTRLTKNLFQDKANRIDVLSHKLYCIIFHFGSFNIFIYFKNFTYDLLHYVQFTNFINNLIWQCNILIWLMLPLLFGWECWSILKKCIVHINIEPSVCVHGWQPV